MKNKKIKNYFIYKSTEGVASITSNTKTWYAFPRKNKLRVTKFEVDCTLEDVPKEDSPKVILYKKRRGLILDNE